MTTIVQDLLSKYGTDNIFQLSEDYHGKYEDDYCNFEYYNNVTNDVVKDYWTTAAACPSFGLFQCKSIHQAIKEQLPINDGLRDMMIERHREACGVGQIEQMLGEYMCGRLVEVNKGRGWKGTGWLTHTFKHRYNSNGYQRECTKALVYNPSKNTLEEVYAHNMVYTDYEQFNSQYQQWFDEIIKDAPLEKLLPSYNTNTLCTKEWNKWAFLKVYKEKYMPNIEGARNSSQERREQIQKEKDEKLMADLIEWAKRKFPDQSEEYQKDIAQRAFNNTKK